MNATKAAHEHYVATRAEAKENGKSRKLGIKKTIRGAAIAREDAENSPNRETCSSSTSSTDYSDHK
jgi:hypothetical protein